VPATRRSLSDVGQLRTLIESQLRYGLEYRLESEVVNGDGSGENLTGILQTSNILSQAKGSDSVATPSTRRSPRSASGSSSRTASRCTRTTGRSSGSPVTTRARRPARAATCTARRRRRPGDDVGPPGRRLRAVPDDTGIVGDFRRPCCGCVRACRSWRAIRTSRSSSRTSSRSSRRCGPPSASCSRRRSARSPRWTNIPIDAGENVTTNARITLFGKMAVIEGQFNFTGASGELNIVVPTELLPAVSALPGFTGGGWLCGGFDASAGNASVVFYFDVPTSTINFDFADGVTAFANGDQIFPANVWTVA
jgi:hypothetical protein